MVNPFLWLILNLLDLYFYVILASVIMSWLIGFNVINGANPYVRQIGYALHRLTEPLLGPIRRRLPDLGGMGHAGTNDNCDRCTGCSTPYFRVTFSIRSTNDWSASGETMTL